MKAGEIVATEVPEPDMPCQQLHGEPRSQALGRADEAGHRGNVAGL
jgi:hypothetical protein